MSMNPSDDNEHAIAVQKSMQRKPQRVILKAQQVHEMNMRNLKRYNIVALLYDILDFPWELQYKKWRPNLIGDLRGEILEAGIGTGRNLAYYHSDVNLTALDLSRVILKYAQKKTKGARCSINFVCEDACNMTSIPTDNYDWIVATFLCCVLPDEVQHLAIEQFARVLKTGGRFRLLEMFYSKNPTLRRRQLFFAPFVEKVYGARFDRNTLEHIEKNKKLKITNTRYMKDDTYLLIEGIRVH